MAGGAVDLVVEDNVDETPRRKPADNGENAEVHQEVAVAVERDGEAVGPRQREAEADGGGQSHRADHVEVLRPVADRERLAADVAVGVHDRLAADRLARRRDRGQPRDAGHEPIRRRVNRRWDSASGNRGFGGSPSGLHDFRRSHAPAARPTAASSRTAATYDASRSVSSTAMTSSTSEHGTPVKKSKPWRVSRVATSRPEITRRLRLDDAGAAARGPEEVAERGEPHERVLALLVADGGGWPAIVVAGEEQRVVGQRREPLSERVVHLLRITAGQVRAPAGADEEGVAGDEAAIDEETLRAGRVPRRVQERQREPSDRQRVVVVDLHEVGAQPRQELAFRLVDVHLERDARGGWMRRRTARPGRGAGSAPLGRGRGGGGGRWGARPATM